VKAAEWKRFATPLLGPEWSFSKALAYRRPVGWVVRGLYAESTRSGGFYLWEVHVPLYWPSNVLALSWSRRLGGGSQRWDRDEAASAAIRESAMRINHVRASVSIDVVKGDDNVVKQEARAYGLVVESKADDAIGVLERVTDHAAEYPWEHEMVRRAAGIRDQLVAGDLIGAQAVISSWRVATADALGIILED
jgi:hypothetical protein